MTGTINMSIEIPKQILRAFKLYNGDLRFNRRKNNIQFTSNTVINDSHHKTFVDADAI